MYQYDELDQALVDQRVAEFRDQTRRHLAGQAVGGASSVRCGCATGCTSSAMRRCCASPSPMVCCSAAQLRKLAAHRAPLRPRLRPLHHAPEPAAATGRGWRTCRTSWPSSPPCRCTPSRPAATASATSPPITSPASRRDEIDDPRPYCEIIRQWSTLHPEFTYLPRKFKIAVTGSPADRAASEVHDIGLHLHARRAGRRSASAVLVGGGPGARPMIGQVIREFLPQRHLLVLPRRDPARLQPPGAPRQHPQGAHQGAGEGARASTHFRELVEAEWQANRERSAAHLPPPEIERVRGYFSAAALRDARDLDATAGPRAALPGLVPLQHAAASGRRAIARVFVSLKAHGSDPRRHELPSRWKRVGTLAERVELGLVRVTHNQNLLLADVRQDRAVRRSGRSSSGSSSRRPTSARSPT